MTVKQLIEKTAVPVYIVDGKQKYYISAWGLLYDTFGDCVINDIQPGVDGDNLEITLKLQPVKNDQRGKCKLR